MSFIAEAATIHGGSQALEAAVTFTADAGVAEAQLSSQYSGPGRNLWGGTVIETICGNPPGHMSFWVNASAAVSISNVYLWDSGGTNKLQYTGASPAKPFSISGGGWQNIILPVTSGDWTAYAGTFGAFDWTNVRLVVIDATGPASGGVYPDPINVFYDDLSFGL